LKPHITYLLQYVQLDSQLITDLNTQHTITYWARAHNFLIHAELYARL